MKTILLVLVLLPLLFVGAIAQDADGDGVLDVDDNCPLVPNADQADGDVLNVCASNPDFIPEQACFAQYKCQYGEHFCNVPMCACLPLDVPCPKVCSDVTDGAICALSWSNSQGEAECIWEAGSADGFGDAC
ncbi:MAG: thrombospondin type 3 repeat-containing protein, partial [Candidatus Altiarchaeota archaeon]|nr:thrombospondin type 3 repeat-containing protein [Candidatus Altiarchaeota archaeon]